MSVIDRRKIGSPTSGPNRKRFIDKIKGKIKDNVKEIIVGKEFDDISKGGTVVVDASDIEEYNFNYDKNQGVDDIILPQNPGVVKGDIIRKPPKGGRGSKAGKGGDTETSDIVVELTEEEMIDILFDGLELPNFVKLTQRKLKTTKLKPAGYTKEGIPPRLSIAKTYEQALGRTMAEGKDEVEYFEDVDLRYKNFIQQEIRMKDALVFYVCDMSASMGLEERTLAKGFFYLLYKFLSSKYDTVTNVFIGHTDRAFVMTQSEFFDLTLSGGTVVQSAMEEVVNQLETVYSEADYNIYLAQVSDGDDFDWGGDIVSYIKSHVLSRLQHMFYMQTNVDRGYNNKSPGVPKSSTLYGKYEGGLEDTGKVSIGFADEMDKVLHFFKKCFTNKG